MKSDGTVLFVEKRTLALQNIKRERWKKRFDNKHSRPTVYSKGDLVNLEYEPQATVDSRKLEPKYRGPYIVARFLTCNYHLENFAQFLVRTKRRGGVSLSRKLMIPARTTWVQDWPNCQVKRVSVPGCIVN